MAQVKVFGLQENLESIKEQLAETIHTCLMHALQLPADKKFQRFFPLAPSDFYFPADRSTRYIIIEISMFEGRSVETKKELIHLLYKCLDQQLNIEPGDLEITIFETPRHNWGIRGLPGDELALSYKMDV